MKTTKYSKIGFVFGVALVGTLTGCVGYVDGPPHERVYAQPPAVYAQAEITTPDNYVYYPGYQVYYSGNAHQYVYLEGRSWVSRTAPPHVSVDVLLASPSVTLDFHDAPAMHHSTVVQQYPKHWAPPGANQGNHEGHDQGKHKGKSERD